MQPQQTLPRLLYQHAHERPDEVALVSIGQGERTWSEIWDMSRRWAGWLEQRGVKCGDRVAALMPQSLEAAYLWMGCCLIGAVDVSINTQFRGEWLRHALATSHAKILVIPRRYLEQVLEVVDGTGIETICLHDTTEPVSSGDVKARVITSSPAEAEPGGSVGEPEVGPNDLACILYTSGTTGASKAVQIPWALIHHTSETYLRFLKRREGHVFYFPYSAYHLAGRIAFHLAAISPGRAVIREQFSTSSFWDDVRTHRCTWTLLFGAPARFLASQPPAPNDRDHSLELVLINPLLPETDVLRSRYGFQTFTTYGMTETGITLNAPPEHAVSKNTGCCGRPVPGFEAMLVDENDMPVPPGAQGELVVRSSDPWTITPGYQGAPEATAKAWRNGWWHTGDVFRQDEEGWYHFVDRTKDMIRRRGENISSVELENAVLSHPAVAEVAAIGVPSDLSDEEVLVAVVPKAKATIDPAELVAFLQDRVPRFAVPRFVRVADSLPRTPETARVQRHQLRAEGVTPQTWDRTVATPLRTATAR